MAGVLSSLRYLLADFIGDDEDTQPFLPEGLPADVASVVSEAIHRLVDYQGAGYANLYVHRLRRFIGRRDKLSSPINVASICAPARSPLNKRIVVPEFMQSSGCAEALSGIGCTNASSPMLSMCAPSARRQLIVALLSAPEPRWRK